jgi:hypothetical protein
MLSAKLAQVNNSVPLVLILKPFPSMVSVTIVHILATLADQDLQFVLPVFLDSI